MASSTFRLKLQKKLQTPAPRLRRVFHLAGLLAVVGFPLLAGLTRWPVFLAAWQEVAQSPQFVAPALVVLACYLVTACFAYAYSLGTRQILPMVLGQAWGLVLLTAWAYAPRGEAAWMFVPRAVAMLTFIGGAANFAQIGRASSPGSSTGRLLLAGGLTLAGMLLTAWPCFPFVPLLALALYIDAAGIAAGVTVPEMLQSLFPVLWALGAWGLGVVLFIVLF